jgi:hypothetical protein
MHNIKILLHVGSQKTATKIFVTPQDDATKSNWVTVTLKLGQTSRESNLS